MLGAEGVAVAVAAVALYVSADYPWWVLAVLALVPDVSMAGYLAGPRLGAACDDAVHTYVGPIALGAATVLADADVAAQIALVWLMHIGRDRALGYGLKYPSGFKHTHLQRIEPAASGPLTRAELAT
jgi:hypothetical protein